MTEQLENDLLRIRIAHAGAELSSVWHKGNRKEYLWQGDPAFWPRKAPVLFPAVGKLKENSYTYAGAGFSLPQHGFARDREFSVLHKSDTAITFVLRSDEASMKAYPFPFELKIGYELEGTGLAVRYEVQNTGKSPMYFSIGAHPGFTCPLHDNEKISDYYLEFEEAETLDRHLLDEGLFNGRTERVMTDQKILELDEELFAKDAIVFKDMRSSQMILKSKRSDYRLTFRFPGFPYFGIWKKPGAPFICLEPWLGIADSIHHTGEIEKKEGIIRLEAQEGFSVAYSIGI